MVRDGGPGLNVVGLPFLGGGKLCYRSIGSLLVVWVREARSICFQCGLRAKLRG